MPKKTPAQTFAAIFARFTAGSTPEERATGERMMDRWLARHGKTRADIPQILAQSVADDAASRPPPPPSDPRDTAPHPFEDPRGSVPNRLRFGLSPEGLALELTGIGPSVALSLVPLTLSAEMEPPELPAYGRILLDVLRGNSALSIRGDEAEEAWRVLTPVMEGWSRNVAPLEEYDAGSSGPLPAQGA